MIIIIIINRISFYAILLLIVLARVRWRGRLELSPPRTRHPRSLAWSAGGRLSHTATSPSHTMSPVRGSPVVFRELFTALVTIISCPSECSPWPSPPSLISRPPPPHHEGGTTKMMHSKHPDECVIVGSGCSIHPLARG